MSDLHQLRALCQSVANGEPHADHGGVWQGERQTVIARYGDDGPEYLSGLVFADTNTWPKQNAEPLNVDC